MILHIVKIKLSPKTSYPPWVDFRQVFPDEVMAIMGKPDAVSTMRSDGKPLILKYHDIELHFGGKNHYGHHLIYSDDEIELSITAEHEERSTPYESI